MGGFLDSKERIIDMVLTDTGKSLLLKGDLHFVYWIPFDDEVDYDPSINGEWLGGQFIPSSSLAVDDKLSLQTRLTEDPLIREASMGYRGLNNRQVDFTNVHRPMYSAPPGVGQTYPMVKAAVSYGTEETKGFVEVEVQQQKKSTLFVQYDDKGQTIIRTFDTGQSAFERTSTSQPKISADYPLSHNEFPKDMQVEGFLVTMYHSSTLKTEKDEFNNDIVIGGFQEILQNRDSKGNIVYRNDLSVDVFKP